jgi:hypothetical protein
MKGTGIESDGTPSMDSIFFHEPGESKHFPTFQFAAGIS